MEGSAGKKARSAGATAGPDRLSALPDCLLHIVLSRLESRKNVQTCVLSRRWRHLWRAVRIVDLDDRDFLSTPPPDEDDQEDTRNLYAQEHVLDRFDEFADNLLFQHRPPAPPLDALRLCVGDKVLRHTSYDRWLRRGVRCAPAALDVRNRGGYCDIRASSLSPGSRRLTRLRLESVTVHDDFMAQLEPLFPALEHLEMQDVTYSTVEPFRIGSGMLKSLVVDNCRERFDRNCKRVVEIAAPRLATLHLSVPLYTDSDAIYGPKPRFTAYAVRGAPSIAGASVRVVDASGRFLGATPRVEYDRPDVVFLRNMAFLRSLRRLVGSLSGATCLELSGIRSIVVQKELFFSPGDRFASVPMLQALSVGDDQHRPPVFGNLKTLVLGECDLGDDLQALWSFLQSTPVLQNLHLKHCELPECLRRRGARNMRSAASNLKLVEITYKDDELFTPELDDEEHASDFLEVLADISRQLRTTINVIKVQ